METVYCPWCCAPTQRPVGVVNRARRRYEKTRQITRFFCCEEHKEEFQCEYNGRSDPYKSNGGLGYRVNRQGYAQIKVTWLTIDERRKYGGMANPAGWIPEHNLVMAWHLRRPLFASEEVRHINGDTTDNRIANLALYRAGNLVTRDEGLYDQMLHIEQANRLACVLMVLAAQVSCVDNPVRIS